MNGLVTEDDLARARADVGFRQQLMMVNLDRLLNVLKDLRKTKDPNPDTARHIREGVALAVKLADRLQKVTNSRDPRAA